MSTTEALKTLGYAPKYRVEEKQGHLRVVHSEADYPDVMVADQVIDQKTAQLFAGSPALLDAVIGAAQCLHIAAARSRSKSDADLLRNMARECEAAAVNATVKL